MTLLEIKDLHVSTDGKEILKGVTLTVDEGEIVALMGPNGSGKSTLAYALMGHPSYKITKGEALYKGKNLFEMSPDERARAGMFLSFQYPTAISGVQVNTFLRTAVNVLRKEPISVPDFSKMLNEKMQQLKIDPSFAARYLNEGFSGGEKKRMEILQMSMLQPSLSILDETDSGTDVDALKIIAEGVNKIKQETNMGVLMITHYERVLELVRPDKVYVMVGGKIVQSGDKQLARQIEEQGYEQFEGASLTIKSS